MNTNFKVF